MKSNTNQVKIIFHIDLNAFFATVASILNPLLKGKPFAVGREHGTKGVLSTASYEARALGIHSAMPIIEAKKIYPALIVVNPNYHIYQDYHNKFINLLKEYSNLVGVASIDEAYVDMTEKSKTMHPLAIATEIQNRLLELYQLPCSIGIAPTLFLAKMASDMKKPLGVVVLRKREIEKILYPLSVADIYGIGKKSYPKLIEKGINTIADFMNLDNKVIILECISLKQYEATYNAILGNSSNIVDPNKHLVNQSISTSETFDSPLVTEFEVLNVLKRQLKEVYQSMIKDDYATKTVTITFRNTAFKTITRSKSFDYTQEYQVIYDNFLTLFYDNYQEEDLRLVGVGLGNLIFRKNMPCDYNLFTYESFSNRTKKIDELMSHFQEKYGKDIINFGFENHKEDK